MEPILIDDWSVCHLESNPYMPPEAQQISLHGTINNHPKGKTGYVNTSPIKDVNKDLITTLSGTVYKLGKVNEDYLKYCEEKGCHVPTQTEPIKLIKAKHEV